MARGSCATGGSPQAIDDFVQGEHADAIAVQPADYVPAIDLYTKAIALSPNFGQAYWLRGRRQFSAGSLEPGNGLASNTAPEMLDRAISDERKAYALGVRDPALATSLGFDIYRQWLNKPSGSVPSDALHFDRLAVSADPADPIHGINVGLALLADGDETKAIEAYQTAVQQILSLGGDHGQQTAWFASGMTDLDNLVGSAFASSRPSLVGQVIQMKERVAGSLAEGKNVEPTDTGATLSIDPSRAGLYVTPTALDVNVPETGWDPVTNDLRREPISLVWYTRSAPGQGSSSGAWNTIAEATDFGASTKSPFGFDASNDVYVHNSNLLSSIPAQCVPNGQYRVEIYIGGHLAYASPVQTLTGIPNLIGRTEPDMEIGVCVPNNWVLKAAPTVQWTGGRNQGARATLAGIMFGYSAKDGSEGALPLPTVFPERSTSRPNADDADRRQQLA